MGSLSMELTWMLTTLDSKIQSTGREGTSLEVLP